jgi:hypothetical protein
VTGVRVGDGRTLVEAELWARGDGQQLKATGAVVVELLAAPE